jgi:hypothetical protein
VVSGLSSGTIYIHAEIGGGGGFRTFGHIVREKGFLIRDLDLPQGLYIQALFTDPTELFRTIVKSSWRLDTKVVLIYLTKIAATG